MHGSTNFLQSLLRKQLVDRLELMIYPCVVGPGKRMFGAGTTAGNVKLTRSQTTPKGVICATYEAAGDIELIEHPA